MFTMHDHDIIIRDVRHIWHPCTEMKSFETVPPFVVHRAQGSYLHTNHGPVIDAIASWWCKSLGHGHPAVVAAIQHQLNTFEHVISANTTHLAMAELGETLAGITGKQHAFFASDGSSAIEIALKLVMQATAIKGHPERNQWIALQHGYHGETFATLAISDVALYKDAYDTNGLRCHFLDSIPYVSGINDPRWNDCSAEWPFIETQLHRYKNKVCGIILEPLLQGAGGMRCYSADFLRRLVQWAHANDIYVVADEIMTGLCRTGKWLACDHAGVNPDIICLSKGLTSGSIPASVVMIDHTIFELFYHEEGTGPSFLHSHTFSGNALAVSAALATLQVMQTEQIAEKAMRLGHDMHRYLTQIAEQSGILHNVRGLGAMVAADLTQPIGKEIAIEALRRGALLRPIGNTLYWLPPLTMDGETLEKLAQITYDAIRAVSNP